MAFIPISEVSNQNSVAMDCFAKKYVLIISVLIISDVVM